MKLSKHLRIFLLYARSDEAAVRRLYRRIVKEGAGVWLDRENILPGQDWESEIRKAIYTSDLVIVCLSNRFSTQGGYRHEELKIALEKANSLPPGGIFIVPVRLENCDLPEPLRRWQRVDLFEAQAYQKLIATLAHHAAFA